MNRRRQAVVHATIALALVLPALHATASNAAPQRAESVTSGASATKTAQRLHMRLPASQGGRPFAANSPWNTPTPTGTKWFDSGLLHQNTTPMNGDSMLHWWVNTGSVGVYYAADTDPFWTFDMPELNAAAWHRVRAAQTFSVRAPADLMDGGDSDHVLVLVSGDTYYEVWNAQVDPAARRVSTRAGGANWAVDSISSGQGAGTLANNDGTRASNFSWAGGLITGDDLKNGSIDHALVLALTAPLLKAGSNPDYVHPATAWDNGGSFGPIKMGSRIGIPAGTPRPAGLSTVGNMVFDALQKYGSFVGDFCGGAWPMFYADKNTVIDAQMQPLYAFWQYGGSADMEKIQPLLRVANYQP